MGQFKKNWLKNVKMKKAKRKRKSNATRCIPISETYDINHPDRSGKGYKSIVLRNGLTVLLISDQTSAVSAAAMSVKFGSFNDPEDMQGLAHLIEHMVFNGSTSNPGENEFKSFVSTRAGEVFANTEMEYMGFSFTIGNDHFKLALEMFANMFNEPLMDIEVLKKEIKTLNQEFEFYKCKDSNRMEQLFAHTSPKGHPFNRFAWGNNQSFSQQEPQALRDCAMKLFREHFIGASMKLVIIGSEALNELEDSVIKYFSKLKRGEKINFVFPEYKDYLWKHGVSYTLESVEDAQSMKITWLIPPISLSHSKIRPAQLIYRLICEESEGSLCFFFKSKYWITSFTASVGHEFTFSDVGDSSFTSTAGGQLFVINLDMTNNGLEHKYEMVSYIYQYLHLLRTCGSSILRRSLIENYKFSLEMKYQCLELDDDQLGNLLNFSLALSVNMLSFPVSCALSLDFGYQFGDLKAIQEMLGNFTTYNMRIDLLSKLSTIEGQEQEEPYFSYKFKEEPIPPHYLQIWETSQDVDVDPALHIPEPNSFMPPTSFWRDDPEYLESEYLYDEEGPSQIMQEDLDYDEMEEGLDSDKSDEANDEDTPFKPIVINGYNKLFYKYEDEIVSTACFKIYMNVCPGVKPHMVSRIYFEMVKNELSRILYEGEDAYISSVLSFGDNNTIELKLFGYERRFRDFTSTIWELFRSFVPTLEAFETITEKMLRQFYLTSRDFIVYAKQLLNESIIEGQFTMDEKFNALKLISFEDVNAFLPKMQQIRIVGLFCGKFSEADCIQILDIFKPYGEFEIPRNLGTKKDLSVISPFRVSAKPKTEIESNSLAKVYYQMCFEENPEDFNLNEVSAFLYLLKSMLDDKLYCDLRLNERLGYHIGCDVHDFYGTKGIFFYVVSSDHKSNHLLEKIHSFISTIRDYLVSVDERTFQLYRSGVDVPDDSGMAQDLIHDDSCVSGHHSAVRLFSENMEKKRVIRLFDQFFVHKPSVVEVLIGSDV